MKKHLTNPFVPHPRASLKDRCKLVLGALLYPLQTRRWRRFVVQNPPVTRLAQRYPRVLHKIYRPYLFRTFRCGARVDTMMGHFEIVQRLGLTSLMVRAAHKPLQLVRFQGKGAAQFELHLATTNTSHREGEWALLLSQDGRQLFQITFTFATIDGVHHLLVGSLQGEAAADASFRMRSATKALEGWRPKHLLFTLLRDLGAHLGFATMQLVSNDNRIVVNWSRRHRITADYDSLWREAGAHQDADGNFLLPCALPPDRPLEQISTNKRAEARRKRDLFAQVSAAARTSVDRFRIPHVLAERAANHALIETAKAA